jgi:hypothetical protein
MNERRRRKNCRVAFSIGVQLKVEEANEALPLAFPSTFIAFHDIL